MYKHNLYKANSMKFTQLILIKRIIPILVISVVGLGIVSPVFAQTPMTPPGPASGSVGLEGTISSPPPTRAATITTPVNGRAFDTTPITVNGLCPQGVMVKLFSNNIFVGSVRCTNGSYSLQIDLFSGQNDLIARVFDDLDQAGPALILSG